MARSQVASDDFQSFADDALLTASANWQTLTSESTAPYTPRIKIWATTNRQVRSYSTTTALPTGLAKARHTGTYANDQYSSVVVNLVTGWHGTPHAIGAIARASADQDANQDCYIFYLYDFMSGGDASCVLAKIVNGTLTNLNTGTVNWTSGDRIEIECEGTTIRACKNGSPLGGAWTQTDSALSTGKPGLAVSCDPSVQFTADDWVGGDITGGGGAVAITPLVGAMTGAGVLTPQGMGVRPPTTVRID